jgi:hypothetical protein
MPLGADYKLVDQAARPDPAPEPAEGEEPVVPTLPAGVYNSIRHGLPPGAGFQRIGSMAAGAGAGAC